MNRCYVYIGDDCFFCSCSTSTAIYVVNSRYLGNQMHVIERLIDVITYEELETMINPTYSSGFRSHQTLPIATEEKSGASEAAIFNMCRYITS